MSLHLPSRQACRLTANAIRSTSQHPSRSVNLVVPIIQRRNASVWDFFKRGKKRDPEDVVGLVEELAKGYKPPKQSVPEQGKLQDSIFGPEENVPETSMTPSEETQAVEPMDPRAMAAALDPKPWARARWQRKKVIQAIQKRGRISRTEQLLKLERQHTHSSAYFKTSMKKLVPIARQIAGKTIDDALVQLRFSKKMAARQVEQALKVARNEAIVSKGMGLGHIKEIPSEDRSAPTKEVGVEDFVALKQKNGKIRMVKPSAIYIDQTWVNKGKYGVSRDYRARGRAYALLHPHTKISFLLKEEKTRLRLAKERVEKKEKQRPWLHHPDRAISAQRQYIMW